jgi:hypothetical protein
MSSAGMRGTSDTDNMNTLDQGRGGSLGGMGQDTELPQDANTGALGEPDVVEVAMIEETVMSPGGASMGYTEQPGTSFRWWYVPAAFVPLAAGGTAIWLWRRNQQSTPAKAYASLAQQGRDWMKQLRNSDATKKASKAMQRGAKVAQTQAKSLPDQAADWRDRSAEAIAALSATVADQVTDTVSDWWGQVSDLWDRNAPTRVQAAKATKQRARNTRAAATGLGAGLAAWWASRQTQSKLSAAQGRIAEAKAKAQARAAKVTAKTSANATKASAKTGKAMSKAGKKANDAYKRTRTFTFAMLIAAMVTYLRTWRQRLMEKQVRETASGRMVPDTYPTFAQR